MIKQIGRYTIEGEIGVGAFGRVYRAHDPNANRTVAIKVLISIEDPETLKRFRVEAGTTAGLAHSNIVTVHDFAEENGSPYLVMEYVEGKTLKDLIAAAEPPGILDKVEIMYQVAEGLRYAHSKGVIHRDMKPANIMVTPDGAVKIMDFGIARLAERDSTLRSRQGDFAGTIPYMAPEQFRGSDTTRLADIFSYGVIYYELLSGIQPFQAKDPGSVMYRITSYDPPSLRETIPDIPEALDNLIQRLIAKERELRVDQMEEVILDTEPILQQLRQARAAEIASEIAPLIDTGDPDKLQKMIGRVLEFDPLHREARKWREQLSAQSRRALLKKRIDTLVQQANEHLSKRQFSEAIASLEGALNLDKTQTDVRALLETAKSSLANTRSATRLLAEARWELQQHRLDKAFEIATRAKELDPDNTEVTPLIESLSHEIHQRRITGVLQHAEELRGQGRYDEALTTIDLLGTDLPGAPDAQILRAKIAAAKLEAGRRAKQAAFRAGLTKAREALEALQLEAAEKAAQQLCSDFSDEPAALEFLAEVRVRLNEQRRIQAVAEVADSARVLIREKRLKDAGEVLQTGLQNFPGEPSLQRLHDMVETLGAAQRRAETIQRAEREAEVCRKSGQLEQAIGVLNDAIASLGPEAALVELKNQLAFELEQRGVSLRIDRAVADAAALVAAGQPQAAVQLLEQQLQEHPLQHSLTTALAGARQAVAEDQASLQRFQHLIAELEAQGEYSQGQEQAERALLKYAGNPDLVDAAARLRRLQRKLNESVGKITASIQAGDYRTAASALVLAQSQFPGVTALSDLKEKISIGEAAALRQQIEGHLRNNDFKLAIERLIASRRVFSRDQAWPVLWKAIETKLLEPARLVDASALLAHFTEVCPDEPEIQQLSSAISSASEALEAERRRASEQKREAEEIGRKQAEQKREAEEIARKQAAELARKQAEEKREAEKLAQKQAEQKREAEEIARKQAAELARKQAEQKREAEKLAQKQAEQKREAEEIARKQTEELTRKRAEQKRETEELTRKQTEELARKQAEQKREAEEIARKQAEELARKQAEEAQQRQRQANLDRGRAAAAAVMQAGDLAGALKLLDGLIRQYPATADLVTERESVIQEIDRRRRERDSLTEKARDAERSGRLEDALEHLKLLEQNNPGDAGIVAEGVRVAALLANRRVQAIEEACAGIRDSIDAGHLEEAASRLRSVGGLTPDRSIRDGPAAALQARLDNLLAANRLADDGKRLFAVGEYKGGSQKYQDAASKIPGESRALQSVLEALVGQATAIAGKDWKGAQPIIAVIAALDPKHRSLAPLQAQVENTRREEMVAGVLKNADASISSGNLERARKIVVDALATYPNEPRLSQRLAHIDSELLKEIQRREQQIALKELGKMESEVAGAKPQRLPKISVRLQEIAAQASPGSEVALKAAQIAQAVAARVASSERKAQEIAKGAGAAAVQQPSGADSSAPKPVLVAGLDRRKLIIGAAVAAGVLIGVYLAIPRGTTSEKLVSVLVNSETSGASVSFGDMSCVTPNCKIKLKPGTYLLAAKKDGYQSITRPITISTQPSEVGIPLALEPLPEMLQVNTNFESGRVSLDERPVGSLRDGQFALSGIRPGRHTLKITDGRASFETEWLSKPGEGPQVSKPVTAADLQATVITNAGVTGNILCNCGVQSVAIDGAAAGQTAQLPTPESAVKSFKEGSHQVSIAGRTMVVDSRPNPTLSVFLSMDRNVGTLVVVTSEDNARVYLNNQLYRRASEHGALRIPLDVGQYSIRAEKDGFQKSNAVTVAIGKGEEKRVEMNLTPLTSILEIAGAVPGAQVTIDGSPAGEADGNGAARLQVKPGSHAIELSKTDYASARFSAEFAAGATVHPDRGQLAMARSIRQPPPPDPAQIETQDWDRIRDSNNVRDFDDFLNRHATGAHAADARTRANRLRQQQQENVARQAEQTAWDGTDKTRKASLQDYLSRFGNGAHAADARTLIAGLDAAETAAAAQRAKEQSDKERRDKEDAASGADEQAIQRTIGAFEAAFNAMDLKGLQAAWTDMPKATADIYRNQFGFSKSVAYQLKPIGRASITGASAVVNCNRALALTAKSGEKPPPRPDRVHVALERAGASWVIRSITPY